MSSTLTLAVGLMMVVSAEPNDALYPATPLNTRPVTTDSPTHFSCTLDTLRKDRECVFESSASRSTDAAKQAKSNESVVLQLAPKLCSARARRSAELKPDKDLMDLCKRDLGDVAQACTLEGEFPLLDDSGRFAPAGRECYLQLVSTLHQTALLAASATDCCHCMANAGCATVPQCLRASASQNPDKEMTTCARSACSNRCTAALPQTQKDDLDFDEPLIPPPDPGMGPAPSQKKLKKKDTSTLEL